jgi:hypothetical protein
VNWAPYVGPTAPTFSGGIWHSTTSTGQDRIYLELTVPSTETLTDFAFATSLNPGYVQADLVRFYSGAVGSTVLLDLNTSSWHGSLTGCSTILISVTNVTPSTLTQIAINGLGGTSPWGASNC